LDNVSGIVNAGEVAAIIGASGAGKTSLLNIIACRIAKTSG
jgi:ABC-type multidrug transport system ATPase subunit